MSDNPGTIKIDGSFATKALDSLRRHSEKNRPGKTLLERSSGDTVYLIIGLQEKKEYKNGKEVLINLKYPLDGSSESYEIVFITKGDSSALKNKLDKIKHLSTVRGISFLVI